MPRRPAVLSSGFPVTGDIKSSILSDVQQEALDMVAFADWIAHSVLWLRSARMTKEGRLHSEGAVDPWSVETMARGLGGSGEQGGHGLPKRLFTVNCRAVLFSSARHVTNNLETRPACQRSRPLTTPVKSGVACRSSCMLAAPWTTDRTGRFPSWMARIFVLQVTRERDVG